MELVEVGLGEAPEHRMSGGGQRQSGDPSVVIVECAFDESGSFRSIDELDRAVVLDEEMFRHVGDGRRFVARMPADRQQQLMLAWREPGLRRLLIAPSQELPEAVAECEQIAVVAVGEGA